MTQPTPLSYQELQDIKYDNSDYWNMMDPSHGSDPIVKMLMEYLPSGSVFEYGTGRGRNALPLAAAGYAVHAQDVTDKPLMDLREAAKDKNLPIQVFQSDAKEHVLDQNYDALVCLRVLHFLETEDAWQVIRNMQEHTNAGWLNAIVLFINETPHGPTPHVRAPFFPAISEMLESYAGWNVLFQERTESEPSKTTNGKCMVKLSVLLRKEQE